MTHEHDENCKGGFTPEEIEMAIGALRLLSSGCTSLSRATLDDRQVIVLCRTFGTHPTLQREVQMPLAVLITGEIVEALQVEETNLVTDRAQAQRLLEETIRPEGLN